MGHVIELVKCFGFCDYVLVPFPISLGDKNRYYDRQIKYKHGITLILKG